MRPRNYHLAILVLAWLCIAIMPEHGTTQPLQSTGDALQSTLGVPGRPDPLLQSVIIRQGETGGFQGKETHNHSQTNITNIERFDGSSNTAISAGIIMNGGLVTGGSTLVTEGSQLDATAAGQGPINQGPDTLTNTHTKTVTNPVTTIVNPPQPPPPSKKPGGKDGGHKLY